MKLDISNNAGPAYSLTCLNQSAQPWSFYMSQQKPDLPQGNMLVWLCTPFNIAPGAYFTFTWSLTYNFVWGLTGKLSSDTYFTAGEVIDASLESQNQTTFSVPGNTPQFSPVTKNDSPGSLTIQNAADVPDEIFSVGIGMSGAPTFVVQAQPNLTNIFTPHPAYYLAAGPSRTPGQQFPEELTQPIKITFPANIYNMRATLDDKHQWTVAPEV